jgi:hypothetical protein
VLEDLDSVAVDEADANSFPSFEDDEAASAVAVSPLFTSSLAAILFPPVPDTAELASALDVFRFCY